MAAIAEDIIIENGEQGQDQQEQQQNQAHLVNGMSPSRINRPSQSQANGSTIITADYTSIPKLYADRSVFITGGTGFMGKVLVEKLLRSCPGIKNIYLLIRPKKGQETAARLNDLLNAPVIVVFLHFSIYPYKPLVYFQLFDTIRKERPNDLNKVIPICGDITAPELGISESDQVCNFCALHYLLFTNQPVPYLQALLFSNVSIVFHSAATVKFDEKLKLSVTINMLGTKRLVQLCHQMLQLDVRRHPLD